MPAPFTMDDGVRYGFAPSPEPAEDTLHRNRIVFQDSDGRVWSAGTDMMEPTMGSAEGFSHALNARVGLDREGLTVFAERVFAVQAQLGVIS